MVEIISSNGHLIGRLSVFSRAFQCKSVHTCQSYEQIDAVAYSFYWLTVCKYQIIIVYNYDSWEFHDWRVIILRESLLHAIPVLAEKGGRAPCLLPRGHVNAYQE